MAEQTLWYKNAVFYEVNVRAFYDSNADGHGDIPGLILKLDYLKDLGVDCLWLLPIYGSPLRDDGYDISDYYQIQPSFGTLEDFKRLVSEVHNRGMRIIMDLVLNHTSDMHPWFQSARSDRSSPYRDYYVWSDTDEKYNQTRIIFIDTEKSNWTWDEKAGQYFWHRFYSTQPDLNYDNPAVQQEMLNVMRYWLDFGVDGFRADAVPYLFEREGTNCENLPETHQFLKHIRQVIDSEYPGRILLCEANQWPEDVRPYFGDGDEFQLGFHFPAMPRIFKSLRCGDGSSLIDIINRTPAIPENCQWCTFLRNHDELTLEMVTEDERQWMWQEFAPEPRMRLNLGIRRRLAPLLDNNPKLIILAYSLLFTLPGSPIIYYGDEIGMGDNIWLPDRNGCRTPMQWSNDLNAGFSEASENMLFNPVVHEQPFDPAHVNVETQSSNPESLLSQIKRLISIRKSHPVISNGTFEWLSSGENNCVLELRRSNETEELIAIHNLTPIDKKARLAFEGCQYVDLLTGNEFDSSLGGNFHINLSPYQTCWLLRRI